MTQMIRGNDVQVLKVKMTDKYVSQGYCNTKSKKKTVVYKCLGFLFYCIS